MREPTREKETSLFVRLNVLTVVVKEQPVSTKTGDAFRPAMPCNNFIVVWECAFGPF